MPQTVDIEGLGPVEFPDDATDQEILAFANSQLGGAEPAAPTPQPGPAEPSTSNDEPGSLRRALQNFAGAVVGTAGSQLVGEGLAPTMQQEARATIDPFLPERVRSGPIPLEQRISPKTVAAGRWLAKQGERMSLPASPGAGTVRKFLETTLPSAAGSMATFLAEGAALRGRVRPSVAIAGSGALASAGDMYLDAERNGADDETKLYAALVGAGVGTTEAIPIAKWLAPRGMAGAFGRALREGAEEGFQEFGQQFVQNITAQRSYDPERPWLQGVGEGGAAGVTLGTVMSLLTSAIGGRRLGKGPKAPVVSPESDLRFDEEPITPTPPPEGGETHGLQGQEEKGQDEVAQAQVEAAQVNPDAAVASAAAEGQAAVFHSVLFPRVPGDGEEMRGLAARMSEEPTIDDVVKARVQNELYQKRGIESDREQARRLVQEVGPEEAFNLVTNPTSDIPGLMRPILASELAARLNTDLLAAKAAEDQGTVDKIADKQAELWTHFNERSTDAASFLRGLQEVFKLTSPEGAEGFYRKQVQKGQKQAREAVQPAVDAVKEEVGKGRKEATGQLPGDKGVQGAVRDAIDGAIEGSQDVQGVAPGKTAAEIRKRAERVRKSINDESKDDLLDAAIRRRLRELRQSLSGLVKSHYAEAGRTKGQLITDLVQQAGLAPEAAKRLADRLDERFNALLKERREAMLARIRDKVPGAKYKRRAAWERLIEAANMGALTDEGAWRVLAPSLKLPVFDQAAAQRVRALAMKVQEAPAGFQRDRLVGQMLDEVQTSVGVPLSERLMSLWYARLLSGPMTHALNVLANGYQLGASLTTATLKNPSTLPELAQAVSRGFVYAVPEVADILKTGRSTGVRMKKAAPGRGLELPTNNKLMRLLSVWKYVGRAMAAEDMSFFMPLYELRSAQMALAQGRLEGFKGKALEKRMMELLGELPAQRVAATTQAEAEGLTGNDRQRRINELMRDLRPQDLRASAYDYALRNTYNSDPYGTMGVWAKHAKGFLRERPTFRLLVPFVDVITNVANESASYVPFVNFPRAWKLWREQEIYGRRAEYGDATDFIAKAVAGASVMLGLLMLFKDQSERPEEERTFDISGPGPKNREARRQLMLTGWRPYSMKVGDTWVRYQEYAPGAALAAIGGYLDALKYGELKDRGAVARLFFAAKGALQAVVDRSALQGIVDLAEAIGNGTAARDETVMRMVTRPVGSVVSSRLAAQLDRFIDPTVSDNSTIEGALLSQVPFVRRLGRPALNVFGEPVEIAPSERFFSRVKQDKLAAFLARKQAWIPMQPASQVQGPDGQPFTLDEAYRFNQLRGPALRARLTPLIPSLETLSSDNVKKIVNRITQAESMRAKVQVIAERRVGRKLPSGALGAGGPGSQ